MLLLIAELLPYCIANMLTCPFLSISRLDDSMSGTPDRMPEPDDECLPLLLVLHRLLQWPLGGSTGPHAAPVVDEVQLHRCEAERRQRIHLGRSATQEGGLIIE